jgi:carbon monoxide dehydrogenase subunit G
MVIEERFVVKSPIRKLWDSFLDPEIVAPCIPGCEMVEAVNEKEYNSIIGAKVGIIAVRFRVRTVIEEIVPFERIRTAGEGRELRNLGQFRQRTTVQFASLSEEATEISYQSNVSVVGKLGTFGDRILKAKAKEIGTKFAEAVRKWFE